MRPETARLMRSKELIALESLTTILSGFSQRIYQIELGQRMLGLFHFSLPAFVQTHFDNEVQSRPGLKQKYEMLIDETRPRADGEKESQLMEVIPQLCERRDKERKRLKWLATLDWYKDQKTMRSQLERCKKRMLAADKLLHALHDKIQMLRKQQSGLYSLKCTLENREQNGGVLDDPTMSTDHERYLEYRAWLLRLPQARKLISDPGHTEDEAVAELMVIEEEGWEFNEGGEANYCVEYVDVDFEDCEDEEQEHPEGMERAANGLDGILEEGRWYRVEEITAAIWLLCRVNGGAVGFR